MEKAITTVITNQQRIELVYQAVIALEAQNWAHIRNSQNSLVAAIEILEAVEEVIHSKYPTHTEGDRNEL
ncbi:hypothetical protein [Polynucleobacter sp. UB-Tiil-W10]|uniref:hypothetical protein n=1 Tax=Polynucleobacter sp. UB-Tiil-W10 TaxID=1855648 RepID=UPI001C0E8C70|nr:hypothetical protein [Polynucleobacter sp. UB-Tiil-W10]MBU3540227.1 hypothetical protein [Polynucleobacter sp. UB-Tiil-W10]